MSSLVSKQTAIAWDLRGYLWNGKEVVLVGPEDAEVPRPRGVVMGVSPTDAVAWIDDARFEEPLAVDLSTVRAVREPHFHEEGDAPTRHRAFFEPRRGPEPMPGQLMLGASRIPKVSNRSRRALERARGLLLSQDDVDVLAALDTAARGRTSVTTKDVAAILGASSQWTVRRLSFLATLRLAFVEEGRRYRWAPGE